MTTAMIGLVVLPASAAPFSKQVGRGFCERNNYVPGNPGGNLYYQYGGPCDLDIFNPGLEGTWWTLFAVENTPDGAVDVLNRSVIAGWTRDLDVPSTSLNVVVRVDVENDGRGFYDYATVPASAFRPDLGGGFGFNVAHNLAPGTRVKIRAVGLDPRGTADGADHHLRRSNEGVPLSSGDHTFIIP
jgi:hypothetical protein